MTQTPTDLSKRTPQEVFGHHAQSLGAEDPDATALDYAENAVLITQDGIFNGKAAIREFFVAVFQAIPKAQWGVKTTYVDNVLFLQWTADSTRGSISDGVDTFIFKNGLIQYQTVRYTLVPK
jgi:hypothetical protein